VDPDIGEAVVNALGLLEAWLGDFTSRAGDGDRQFPAAFLARSVACLRGIEILRGQRDDLCAVLLRALVESNLFGLYALLGGDEALAKLRGDHRRNVENFISRNSTPELLEAVAGWTVDKDQVSVEQVARELAPLLKAAGELVADPLGIYDVIYRSTSTFDAHATGAAVRYMREDNGLLRMVLHPATVGVTPDVCLSIGTLYTVYFARYIFERAGFSVARIDELLVSLGEALGRP